MRINPSEIEITYIRSPGPGGQNVNKVASAAQLRFDVKTSSSLSDEVRARILTKLASRLTTEGVLIIKASRFRSQERNKQDALERFFNMLEHAIFIPKKRKKTKPTHASKERRLETKKRHAKNKILRSKRNLSNL